MVYCGKPSKGCGACRARKVKCDQATPACKRCLKSNRVCPGYRDQLSLLFRDESSAVAQKAKSAAAPHDRKSNYYVSPSPGTSSFNSEPSTEFDFVSTSIQTSPYSTGSFENPEYGDDDECAPLALMPLSADRRQQAICFCFSNFRWLNQSLSGFNIDADVSSTATVAEKAMMKGIVAVGMASISRLGPSSQSMKMQAQREYYDALKLTNAAISRPKQAIEDATLTAVLCMSLFEIVTSRKPERIDAFIEHTRGATALLELRGEDQLVRSQGLEMFQFLRNEIIVSCIMRYLPIPPALLLLSEKATLLPNAPYISKLSHEVCVITARINEIRIEDLRSRRASLDTSILSRALALDSEIETMVNNRLSSEIMPQIYTSAPGQFFGNVEHIAPFEGVYHTYDSFFGAMVANNLRDARLFIIEIIFNCYSRMIRQGHFIPPPEFKEHCYRLRDVARELARDICATVPFLCGYIDASDPNLNGRKIISTSGGLALLFPLFIAASVDGYGSACSDWVAQCFSLIGREMGIDQALALVDILPTEQGMPEFVDSL